MDEYNAWQAERDANMKASERPRSTWPALPEGKADSGKESVLRRKISKWALGEGIPCQCFRQSKKAKGFLVPGWPD